MSFQLASITRELRRGIPRGQILTDSGELSLYDSDGLCLHRSPPSGVVVAYNADQVQHAVRTFHRSRVPFVPRGAGTGLSGGAVALDDAWVIDVNRMNRILGIDVLDRIARVEPGVVNLDLDQAAAQYGLRFAPDPSSQKACTLGGNLAENSGGPHCFLHGMTTRHVLSLDVILPDGERATIGAPPGEWIDEDWRGVFVGAEGTFGVTVEAVVSLIPRPEQVRTALAAFSDLRQACRAVSRIISDGIRPAALEILDRLTIAAVESSVFRAGYPQDAEAVLLLEQEGSREEVESEAPLLETACRTEGALSYESADDPDERARLWRGRKGAFGAMGRVNTDLYVLDGVVPRSRLAEAIEKIEQIGQRYGIVLCNVFHAGDGNLHPNISLDARDTDTRDKVLRAGADILRLCVELGGTLSGEHGIGMEKREFMSLVFDEADLDTQKRLRRVVDPMGLANPGKIFPTGRGCVESGFRGAGHVERTQRVLGE